MAGYIKLFRKFIDWEWYNDTNAKSLFLHCLLKANWEDSTWQGILIKKGSFLTGRQKLAKELNLTEMQIRTALKKLKSSNEITVNSTNEYSIITVNNWVSYQDNQQNNQQNVQKITSEITSTPPSCNKHFEYIDNQQNNQQITSEITSHITTIKEYKNKRNIEEEEEESAIKILKNWYGSEYKNVHLTDKEYQKLLGITLSEEALNLLIEDLSQKIAEGKEKNWSQETPNIHYARLKAYWNYRRKNPDKFREKPSEPQQSYYSNEIED